MCVWGVGVTVVWPPQHQLGTGMLYKMVIDRVAGVMEAVYFYIWLVSKSWNSGKIVMESCGKVMEFHFRICVVTLPSLGPIRFMYGDINIWSILIVYYSSPSLSVGGRMKNVLATVAKTSENF